MPVVIYIHGGSWYEGDKQGDDPIKQNMALKSKIFTDAGFLFVSINHRLSPYPPTDDPDRIMHPVHAQDVATAIAWVYENIDDYGGDRDRIGLLGWSSGGHLSALVATDETYLAEAGLSLSVITCSSSLNSAALEIPTTIANSSDARNKKYFNAFGKNPKVWHDASPMFHVEADKGIPPFLLIHEESHLTNRIQAEFYDALYEIDVPIDHYYAKGLEHREINWAIGIDEKLTEAVLNFYMNWLL
jgi:acetyl esterase/lipase